jgi:PKD repeat protein
MSANSMSARRVVSMSAVAGLVAALAAVGLATAPSAAALLPGPAPTSEPTSNNVTADALPTVQIDGVVWSQAIVGNTVYAGGNFANARPAGAAPGTNLTPRGDLLAYNLSTGVLDPSFAPAFNAQVKSVAASPDGSRIYVGGQFTSVSGVNRYRVAAFSTATGALISNFKPIMSTQVNSIVATNTTVYVGGVFTTANGVVRNRLAAFNASDGALTAWNPNADYNVNAMVISPDGSLVIAGGAFKNVGGQPEYGLAAIDAATGAVKPWAANQKVRDAGTQSAIESLSTDGTAIYGTGYVFGAGGNLEGAFSADPDTGNINWIEDCHGDTYSAFGMNGVVYTVSHSHLCSNVGGFPQTDPWTDHRGLAWTANAVGTIAHDTQGYFDWFGNPAPSQYNWYPDLTPGTFTGQGQAAWQVSGNGKYLVMGGEFTSVNFNGGQQGLVRFAVRPVAPGKEAPRVAGASFVPTLGATSSTTARVSWQANWDRDNQNLTYKVIRNNNAAAPVYTTTATSQFWNRPSLSFLDAGLTPGATYTYKIYAVDPFGSTTVGNNVSITMPTTSPSPYVQQVLNDGPSNYWRLGETSGTTGVDGVGGNDLVEGSGVGHGAAGASTGDADKAATFNGTSSGTAGASTSIPGPNTFSLEGFVKTTSTLGGKIIGFGGARSGSSSSYDRHIYLDNAGHVLFGVYTGGPRVVSSSGTYRDGRWHHIVGSLSSAGMALYVDGARVGFDASVTSAQAYSGYWRVGGDNLSSWPSQPASNYLNATIDDVAVYPFALTQTQVSAHYRASTGVANHAPSALFTSSCTQLGCSFDGSGSADTDGTVSGYSWNFGDGGSAGSATTNHTYAASGTYSVTLTVTDNQGATAASTQSVTVSGPNAAPAAAFTPTCSNLGCSFDASASSDPDGSVVGYAWAFGDGASATGVTASHTFGANGTYSVTLTVTDNRGATNQTTRTVTVSAAVIAADSFARTVSNGWGSADTGGAWTVGGTASSTFSVSPGTGGMQVPAPGAQPTAYLNGVSAGDSDSSVDFTADKAQTGNSNFYLYFSARHAGTSQYRARVKQVGTGGIQLSLTKVVAGTETVLVTNTISGLTFTPGQYLRMRLRVSGTSSVTLSGKVWAAGSTEPTTWQATATDATNPLGPGGPGLSFYLSTTATNAPVLASVRNLAVGPVNGP